MTTNAVEARKMRLAEVKAGYARGWSYIPLNGKVPIQQEWQKRERESLQQALQWAGRGNVGIRTGAASHLIVIDRDKGGDLSKLNLPATWQAITGSGGDHVYCGLPPGVAIGNSAGKLGPHIDVRCDGGQVVAVGSVHPATGKPYVWAPGRSPADLPLAKLPTHIVALLTKPDRQPPHERQPGGNGQVAPAQAGGGYAHAALTREVEAVRSAPEGSRNDQLNKSAYALGQLVGGNALDRTAVEAELLTAAQAAGLDAVEARGTIDSGITAGLAEPRQAPATQRAGISKSGLMALARQYIAEQQTRDSKRTLQWHRDQFYGYDGYRYRPVSDSELEAIVLLWLDSVGGPAKPRVAHDVLRCLRGLCRVHFDLELPLHLDGVDASQWIALRNGIIDVSELLATGRTVPQPHTPDWLTLTCLPFDYQPEATCPTWLRFLSEVMQADPDRIALLQQWCGYNLVHDVSLHRFALLVGDGANGKSVFLKVLEALLGADNVSHVPLEMFAGRFQLAPSIGKLANIAGEVGELARPDEATFKSFVAGDPIQIDRKHLPPIQVTPTARVTIAGNSRPRWMDRSEGIWRRMLLIPFRVTIPDDRQDRHLADRIIGGELAGVLNWSLAGLCDLRGAGGFALPDVCKDELADYRQESNPARAFLQDECSAEPGAEIRAGDLYKAYAGWCRERGYRPLHENHFAIEVRRLYAVERFQHRDGQRRAWWLAGIACPAADGGEGWS